MVRYLERLGGPLALQAYPRRKDIQWALLFLRFLELDQPRFVL